MKQAVIPGGHLDALTLDEARELIEGVFQKQTEERVRASATIALDGTGSGKDEVYTCPVGFEFEARRVTLELGGADPVTGAVALNAAGHNVRYLRSGAIIAWGQPFYGSVLQVPGSESWGDEQGPYVRNGEVFEVAAVGLTPNVNLEVLVEGIQRRLPGPQGTAS